jgi:hypothetical protein
LRTVDDIRQALEALDLEDIWVEAPPRGGVIEGRGHVRKKSTEA